MRLGQNSTKVETKRFLADGDVEAGGVAAGIAAALDR